jgi:hypothetical protein
MKCIFSLLIGISLVMAATAQDYKAWSETDRKYLLENLTRSRDLLVKETQNLSEEQWNFKESPDRWSIKEVVEHIDLWELLFQREISQAIGAGPQAELAKAAKPDSLYFGFIMETTRMFV